MHLYTMPGSSQSFLEGFGAITFAPGWNCLSLQFLGSSSKKRASRFFLLDLVQICRLFGSLLSFGVLISTSLLTDWFSSQASWASGGFFSWISWTLETLLCESHEVTLRCLWVFSGSWLWTPLTCGVFSWWTSLKSGGFTWPASWACVASFGDLTFLEYGGLFWLASWSWSCGGFSWWTSSKLGGLLHSDLFRDGGPFA